MFIKFIITIIGFVALAFPTAVPGAEPQCLDCHPDKKENKVVHPAIEMGCNSCHTGTHMGEKPAPKLTAAMPDLCYGCHDQGKFSTKVQHAPVTGGMCTSCHNPHASAQPKLLLAGIPDICFTCHDAAMMKKKVVHPPAKDGQCTFCHAHHGSDHIAILTSPEADLCTSCHDQQSSGKHVMAGFDPVDSHPLKGRPDPSRPGRDMSCVSCHDPHASERKKLFTGGGEDRGGICLKCHTKIKVSP